MTYGGGCGPLQESEPDKYFAFTSTRGSSPRVFEYDDDPDGVEALSNLIRAEDIIALIHGKRVVFEQASLVELSVGKQRIEHKLKIGG
jgi:hypothetical protein